MDKILYKLDTFEGPLDLLLTLIQKNKVSIYDIPIVEITAQYLEAIDGIGSCRRGRRASAAWRQASRKPRRRGRGRSERRTCA